MNKIKRMDDLKPSVPSDEPEQQDADKIPVQPLLAPQLDIIALYPDCFDLTRPRPLKLKIHKDLIAAGHKRSDIKHVLGRYCGRIRYLQSVQPGAVRVDLQGQPAGEVTEAECDSPRERLALICAQRLAIPLKPKPVKIKKIEKVKKPKAVQEAKPVPPLDAPLTSESIVSGRLELTVKFTEPPQPVIVKSGMKIGVQTDTALVVTTLKPKVWKKLEKAQVDWTQWVAAMTGKLGAQVGSDAGTIVMLEEASLQVFEKKVKVEKI
ncbi:ProQ/FINO family protein [Chromatium okenii]|nr:ProQ/FinO family protein [Chromatium okenii]